MSQSEENNAFKQIIPEEELTATDRESVLRTIETAQLFIDMLDLVSAKHVQTRIKIINTLSGGKDSNKE